MEEINKIDRQMLKCVFFNLIKRAQSCEDAYGLQFQHLLWSFLLITYIPLVYTFFVFFLCEWVAFILKHPVVSEKQKTTSINFQHISVKISCNFRRNFKQLVESFKKNSMTDISESLLCNGKNCIEFFYMWREFKELIIFEYFPINFRIICRKYYINF